MTQWQYVTSPDFDLAFNEDAHIADFATQAEETDYERHDSFLIELIKRVCRDVLRDDADKHTYHLEDWWPNHTRYVTVSADSCTRELIDAFRALLTDKFADYRIQVIVNEDLTMDDSPELGALVIYADRIVVEHDVAERCRLDGT